MVCVRKSFWLPCHTVLELSFKEESEMPKLKTKSGAKKRFSLTANGKVRSNQSGKKHGMVKRTKKQLRNQRGTTTLCDADARIIKKFLPYG